MPERETSVPPRQSDTQGDRKPIIIELDPDPEKRRDEAATRTPGQRFNDGARDPLDSEEAEMEEIVESGDRLQTDDLTRNGGRPSEIDDVEQPPPQT